MADSHEQVAHDLAVLTLSPMPTALPAPVVVLPAAQHDHDATLLLLPGFTCSAQSMAESWWRQPHAT